MIAVVSVCNCIIFSVCVAAFVALSRHVSSHNRVIRVINGEIVEGRTTGYNAVRYFAEIATLHGTKSFMLWKFTLHRRYFGQQHCGGALITPSIVQTACHCLSHEEKPSRFGIVQYPQINHQWESTMVVYIGVNKQYGEGWTMSSVSPLKSRKFVIHQACGQLPQGTVEVTTHDFGWISIDPNWDPNNKLLDRVNFPPLYMADETEKIWDITMQRQSVCLIQGFGLYKINKIDDDNWLLRHGWSVVVSHGKCTWHTGYNLAHVEGNDLVSWFCTVPFSKYYQTTGPGDSGGPVTCNNLYVGIVHGALNYNVDDSRDYEIFNVLNLHSALKFAPFENTWEFRTDFIRVMDDYGRTQVDILRILLPTEYQQE